MTVATQNQIGSKSVSSSLSTVREKGEDYIHHIVDVSEVKRSILEREGKVARGGKQEMSSSFDSSLLPSSTRREIKTYIFFVVGH